MQRQCNNVEKSPYELPSDYQLYLQLHFIFPELSGDFRLIV